jgi:D-beta-D-heptose 7-phosphate kinase/D-beta-D-heptose 1-phosphate adenosyltransferase
LPIKGAVRTPLTVLVKGADYKREEVVGGDVVEAAGGTVVLVDVVRGHSTTGMVRRSAESAS